MCKPHEPKIYVTPKSINPLPEALSHQRNARVIQFEVVRVWFCFAGGSDLDETDLECVQKRLRNRMHM